MEPAFTVLPDETSSAADKEFRTSAAERSDSSASGSAFPEVRLFRIPQRRDRKGQPRETWRRHLLAEAGVDIDLVEENRSVSAQPGTIHGLHFQKAPRSQDKFVRVARGSIFDVAVDIRPGSPTFGRHVSTVLTAEGGEALVIPAGFAHGYCTLEAHTEVVYATSDYYSADHAAGIAFDDPELAIDWPLAGRKPIVSDKDRALPALRHVRLTDTRMSGKARAAQSSMRVLVTGGAGFIGSAVVRHLIARSRHAVLNLDRLSSAASAATLESVFDDPRYELRIGDVCDTRLLESVFQEFRPHCVIHLAAETRTDRPFAESEAFLRTNTIGTLRLLQAATAYFEKLDPAARARFRFLHVSTDEVFGARDARDPAFSGAARYDPLSPYLASRAAGDHVVRAWGHTYGLPVLVTTCSNIFGPYQALEDLIPRAIVGVATGQHLPDLVGNDSVRDWLFVEDLAEALVTVAERGQIGSPYLIGGSVHRSDRQVAAAIADLVEDHVGPLSDGRRRRDLIAGTDEASSEDYRYCLVEQSGGEKDLGWHPAHSFEAGLRETVTWYLENEGWWRPLVRPVGTNGFKAHPVASEVARL